MIKRYISYLIIHDGLGHLAALIFYPIAYLNREWARKERINNRLAKLLWYMLNDDYDYGDPFFREKHQKGNSKFDMFILSYKWAAWRNPLDNYHWSGKKRTGEEIVITSITTCHREGVPEGMWRTVKTCDENKVFKDKHGDYIDYSNSILGKQWYVFSDNNVRYFRKSGTILLKLFKNKYLVHQYKFGMGGVNYECQWNWSILKSFK